MQSDRWLNVTEIAEHLGVKTNTAYKWLAKNIIPAHKVGKPWRFDANEIYHWICSGDAAEEKMSSGSYKDNDQWRTISGSPC